MKKWFMMILSCLLVLVVPAFAFAEEDGAAAPEDTSQPRLMVTDYTVDGDYLMPGKETEVTITLKNFSNRKALGNIKLSIADDSGSIKPVGTGTQFVERIYAGSKYEWTVTLTAAVNAEIGEHAVTVTAEYEDKYYTAYTASDTLRLDVRQTVGLDYSGLQLPAKIIAGETASVEMTFMNTGKSKVRNVKVDFAVDGLESGGTTFIGEIEPGANAAANANLRAAADLTGEVAGKATVQYQDEFGTDYTQEVALSCVAEQKPEKAEEPEVEQEKKNPQWWLFLLGGAAAGGTVGAVIPISVNARKRRLEDEKML